MVWLVLGLVLFLGVHSVAIVSPGGRDRLVAGMGDIEAIKALTEMMRSTPSILRV